MKILNEVSVDYLREFKFIDKHYLNYHWNEEQWNSFIDVYGNTSYVFYETRDDHVISFALFNYYDFEKTLHLLKIITQEADRGKGHAKALMLRTINSCRDRGINKIILEVAKHNIPAISLYQSMGFHEIRSIKNYYSDGSDALGMMIEL